MLPASLIHGNATTANIPNGEGNGGLNEATTDISPEKQSDINTFSNVMQRVKPVVNNQLTKDQPGAGRVVDDDKVHSTKEADTALPPYGVNLPYLLLQDPVTNSLSIKSSLSNGVSSLETTVGNGAIFTSTLPNSVTMNPVGEKRLPELSPSSTAVDAEDSKDGSMKRVAGRLPPELSPSLTAVDAGDSTDGSAKRIAERLLPELSPSSTTVDAEEPKEGSVVQVAQRLLTELQSSTTEGDTADLNNESGKQAVNKLLPELRQPSLAAEAVMSNDSLDKHAMERSSSTQQASSTVIKADDSNTLTSGIDQSSRNASAASPAVPALHETHDAIQTVMRERDIFTDKPSVTDTTAKTEIETVNTSAAMNSQLQGVDKIAQNAATTSITMPFSHPEWNDEFSNRITWLIGQDVQSASIKINPSHLGPIEMKVSILNDQVNVSFTSHHASVREALDASLPGLRERLENNGLQLGDANVNNRSFTDHNQTNHHEFTQSNKQNGFFDTNFSGNHAEDIRDSSTSILSNTGIDIFA